MSNLLESMIEESGISFFIYADKSERYDFEGVFLKDGEPFAVGQWVKKELHLIFREGEEPTDFNPYIVAATYAHPDMYLNDKKVYKSIEHTEMVDMFAQRYCKAIENIRYEFEVVSKENHTITGVFLEKGVPKMVGVLKDFTSENDQLTTYFDGDGLIEMVRSREIIAAVCIATGLNRGTDWFNQKLDKEICAEIFEQHKTVKKAS